MSNFKNRFQPYVPLIAGLAVLTLFTMLSGLWHYQTDLTNQMSKAQTAGRTVKTALRSSSNSPTTAKLNHELTSSGQALAQAGTSQNLNSVGRTANSSIAQGTNNGNNATDGTASLTVGAASQPTIISLSLSINGQAKGTVQLAAGSTQCDVLTQALAQGLISDLNMSYNSNYGTDAVYVINGIGKPGVVQWTYKVNNIDPHFGCSYIKAQNGDSVAWQY